MSEGNLTAVARDPAIKLFGRTISLPEPQFSDDSSLDNGSSLRAKSETEECGNEAISFEQPQTSIKQPIASNATLKPKGDSDESDGVEEPKQMKRPEKILPCPRCNSSDTKFCYFNNYNVNQPRHFCKSCQRYWTAGGTVRNVPVGAGRRRNKHLVSQYHQVFASFDSGRALVGEAPDSANQLQTGEESSSSCTGSSPNHEMVLKFGPESPHCDNPGASLESPHCDNPGASLTAPSFGLRPGDKIDVSSQHQLDHYITQISVPNRSHSNCSVSLPLPGVGEPNISFQIVPAAYMNCIPVWVNESGNISLAVSSSNHLQVLGKHSRDVKNGHRGKAEDCMTVPKTFRIQEVDEA